MSVDGPSGQYYGLFTFGEFVGVLFVTWFTPFMFLCMGALISHLLLAQRDGTRYQRKDVRRWMFVALTVINFAIILFCWLVLIKPWVYNIKGKKVFGPDPDQGNRLSSFWGAAIFMGALATTAALFWQLYRSSKQNEYAVS